MISPKEPQQQWEMSCLQGACNLVTWQGCIQPAMKHKAQGDNAMEETDTGTSVKRLGMAHHPEAPTRGYEPSTMPPYAFDRSHTAGLPLVMPQPFHVSNVCVGWWSLCGYWGDPERFPRNWLIDPRKCRQDECYIQKEEGRWSTCPDFKTRDLYSKISLWFFSFGIKDSSCKKCYLCKI